MSYPIPVRIGDQNFASMNQARLSFTGILHGCPEGSSLSGTDSTQVLALLPASKLADVNTGSFVRVVRGKFGRSCFEVPFTEHRWQKISIKKSIKQKILGNLEQMF